MCSAFPFLKAQRECADSPQGSPGTIHNCSNSRVPPFSGGLYHGSNGDEDGDESEDGNGSRDGADNRSQSATAKNLRNKGGTNNKSSKPSIQTADPLIEPLYEEDVIDGFAIISFSSYDDLEVPLKPNSVF